MENSDERYIHIRNGPYIGKKIFDPEVMIHEDHIVKIVAPEAPPVFYYIDCLGRAEYISSRSNTATQARQPHIVHAEELT